MMHYSCTVVQLNTGMVNLLYYLWKDSVRNRLTLHIANLA